jgi:2-polyprenyl-6-methoxyphenol hydroxylase-like FAD-dependent oxidoreductase
LTGNDFSTIRADLEGHSLKRLDEGAPRRAKRACDGKREERWIGGSIPNVLRKPYRPVWALVGDAGRHVAPSTAAGLSDAFRDAECLAEATDEGFSGRRPLDEALAAYARRRHTVALPCYEFACQNSPVPRRRRYQVGLKPGMTL